MYKTKIIAEAGINANGDVSIAKKLIDVAKDAGCDAVKFQKRTIGLVYSKEELDKHRESPWGTTNRQQKEGLEFSEEEMKELHNYCKQKDIDFFWSSWDLESQKLLRKFNIKYNKVASAMLTNREFLEMIAEEKKHTFISTGMSTMQQIEKAVNIFNRASCPFELMACTSTYPCPDEQVNLNFIRTLRERPGFGWKIGFSSHSPGIIFPVAAVALGATSVEVHITMDRTMYGSDQASSIEPPGLRKMVEYIRAIEIGLGNGKKVVYDSEKQIIQKLRKVDTL